MSRSLDLRVAVVGPESTGKTTTIEYLRSWLEGRRIGAAVVADQGRLLAQRLPSGFAWTYRQQWATSLMHQAAEAAESAVLDAGGGGVLLCDGTPATPAVWHMVAMRNRPGYEAGPPVVTPKLLTAAHDSSYDLILLMDADLPWEPDGVRDDPDARAESVAEYQRLYPGAHLLSGRERQHNAVALVAALI